jgi:Chromosome segregation ATPases
LSVKNSEINAKLSETITDKEEFVLSLSSQLRILEQEKVEFQGTIESKDLEIQDLERKLSVFIQENNYFKQKLEESQTELEKFLEVHQNHQILLKDLKDNQTELKHKNEVLVNENKSLKLKISDLEEKNREVFENLEKDLNQRAKDYKKGRWIF